MTDNITKFDAVRLAHAYHDAMTMVSSKSNFNVKHGPRWTLEFYLHISQRLGVKLHNESWERHAWDVVRELEAKRREAFRKVFKGG